MNLSEERKSAREEWQASREEQTRLRLLAERRLRVRTDVIRPRARESRHPREFGR